MDRLPFARELCVDCEGGQYKTFLLRFRPRHQLVDPAVKLSDRQKLVQEKIRDQLRLNAPAAPIVIP
jgi:hypothetical protein